MYLGKLAMLFCSFRGFHFRYRGKKNAVSLNISWPRRKFLEKILLFKLNTSLSFLIIIVIMVLFSIDCKFILCFFSPILAVLGYRFGYYSLKKKDLVLLL